MSELSELNPYVGARNVPCTHLKLHPFYATPTTSSTAAQLQLLLYVSLWLPHGRPRPISVHNGTQWGCWACLLLVCWM